MAVWRRRPQRTLIHSDQGSQYGNDDWQRFCREHHPEPSMSRCSNCCDNAVAESFFSSLKRSASKNEIYRTRDLAKADIFEYIEVLYNRTRRHLGGVTARRLNAPHREVRRCPPHSVGIVPRHGAWPARSDLIAQSGDAILQKNIGAIYPQCPGSSKRAAQ